MKQIQVTNVDYQTVIQSITSVNSFVKHARASLLQSTYEGIFRTNKEETNPVRNTTGKQLLFINLYLFIYS